MQLSEFVWTIRSSAWVVYKNFLLIDATCGSKISSDLKCLFFAVSLFSHFTNTPLTLNRWFSWFKPTESNEPNRVPNRFTAFANSRCQYLLKSTSMGSNPLLVRAVKSKPKAFWDFKVNPGLKIDETFYEEARWIEAYQARSLHVREGARAWGNPPAASCNWKFILPTQDIINQIIL